MKETILVIDDEEDLLLTLAYNLKEEGFAVQTAASGEKGLEIAESQPLPYLILLDLMLPGISGLEVCNRLRNNERTADIPIIMLTAKGEDFDRVVGFEIGTDDYIIKPFNVRELILRIRALLRRTKGKVESDRRQLVNFGCLKIDHEAHRLWVDDEEVFVTALEFRLINTMMDRKGRVQSRDTLLNDVWGINAFVQSRTVDVHVKRLRKKLGRAGEYVETIRGVGYRFRETP